MRERGETSQLLKNSIALTKNQFGKSVKIVRSNNGSEFTWNPIEVFYQENEILCQSSYVDTPQQNGRLEQKYCHVLNVARVLMFKANFPIKFLEECVLPAAHLINITLSKLLF